MTVNDGFVNPGIDYISTGILTAATAAFSANAGLVIQISGTTAGSEHDQLSVTSGVTLGNAELELERLASVPEGSILTIVDNDSGSPIGGTFGGLPEGANVSAGGQIFRISYVGGDGNDITLQASEAVSLEPPALPDLTVGEPVSVTFISIGGIPPYTYSVVTDELPAGLVLNGATGELTGIPTTAGPYEFRIRSEDSLGGFDTIEYEGDVLPAPVPSLPQIGLWALAIALAGLGYARLRAVR
jgi:hypothetical protein